MTWINKFNHIIFLTSLGFFWIIYMFLRYTIMYSPLRLIKEYSNNYLLIFSFIMLFFQTYNVIKIVLNKENPLFIKKFLIKFYKEPIQYIFDNYFKNLIFVGDILMFICKYLTEIYKKFKQYCINILYITIDLLPRFMLLVAFFYDIFIAETFYYSIIISTIALPILFFCKILIYILIDFCELNKTILEKALDITEQNKKFIVKLNKEFLHLHKNLNKYTEQYFLFKHTLMLLTLLQYKSTNIYYLMFLNCSTIIFFIGFLKIIFMLHLIILNNKFYFILLLLLVLVMLFKHKIQC